MADPVSITGLALQLAFTLKQLYDYGRQVGGAKADIKRLCLDLSALRSLLDDFRAAGTALSTPSALSEALQSAQTTLHELSSLLSLPTSSFSRLKQSLTWPLKDADVTKILQRLERAKTMLILSLMGDVHQTVRQDMDELKHSVGLVLANQDDSKDAECRHQIIDWIAPISPDFAHRKACAVWEGSDSGLSLIKEIRHASSAWRIMTLVGLSGTGKSTLFSRLVDHMAADTTPRTVAYMYCLYNAAQTQDVRSIFGAWIAQLWPLRPAALRRFQDYTTTRESVPTSLLKDALIEIAESVGQITLAIDALNESRTSVDISSELLHLVQSSSAIHIVVSTTPSDPAVLELQSSQMFRQMLLNAENMNPDIQEYIRRELAKHSVLRRMDEKDILGTVLHQANGMFRWASCQMSLLAEQPTPKNVRKALGRLPETLNETYVALLQRVGECVKDVVREALFWLSLSKRPLRLTELVEAVAFEPEDSYIDDDCRIQPSTKLVEMCHGLVVLDTTSDTVTLAHSSIRAFLTSDFICESPVAYFAIDESADQASLVTKCLSYLLMDQFDMSLCIQGESDSLQERFPLLNYASHFWPVHCAAQGILAPEQTALIERFFWTHRSSAAGGNFTFWVSQLVPVVAVDVVQNAEPLYYAASFGLTQIVESMLRNGWVSLEEQNSPWYIDHRCGRGTSTALQVACWRGHTEIVRLLLEAGADPNSRNIVGATCLYCARRRGHMEIERLLTSIGARDIWWPEAMPAVEISTVRSIISEVLAIDPSDLTDTAVLEDLGMDSLSTVEISTRIRKEAGFDLPPLFMLMSTTIKELEEYVAGGRHQEPRDHTEHNNATDVLSQVYPYMGEGSLAPKVSILLDRNGPF